MTKTSLVYDLESCGRCGGTGHYSYNSMTGTTCFKCRGQRRLPTRAGKKAQAAVLAFIAERHSVVASQLCPGDRIRIEGVYRSVVSIQLHGLNGCSSSNGVETPTYRVTIELNHPIRSQFGAYSSLSTTINTVYVKAVRGAAWDDVVAFARTIKKGVSVVTTETPAPVHA